VPFAADLAHDDQPGLLADGFIHDDFVGHAGVLHLVHQVGTFPAGQADYLVQGRDIHDVKQDDFGRQGPGRRQRQPVGRERRLRAVHRY